jgi:hypothetical protein
VVRAKVAPRLVLIEGTEEARTRTIVQEHAEVSRTQRKGRPLFSAVIVEFPKKFQNDGAANVATESALRDGLDVAVLLQISSPDRERESADRFAPRGRSNDRSGSYFEARETQESSYLPGPMAPSGKMPCSEIHSKDLSKTSFV